MTYIALSTLASNVDVELMGRVIAQDLKQTCTAGSKRGGVATTSSQSSPSSMSSLPSTKPNNSSIFSSRRARR